MEAASHGTPINNIPGHAVVHFVDSNYVSWRVKHSWGRHNSFLGSVLVTSVLSKTYCKSFGGCLRSVIADDSTALATTRESHDDAMREEAAAITRQQAAVAQHTPAPPPKRARRDVQACPVTTASTSVTRGARAGPTSPTFQGKHPSVYSSQCRNPARTESDAGGDVNSSEASSNDAQAQGGEDVPGGSGPTAAEIRAAIEANPDLLRELGLARVGGPSETAVAIQTDVHTARAIAPVIAELESRLAIATFRNESYQSMFKEASAALQIMKDSILDMRARLRR